MSSYLCLSHDSEFGLACFVMMETNEVQVCLPKVEEIKYFGVFFTNEEKNQQ